MRRARAKACGSPPISAARSPISPFRRGDRQAAPSARRCRRRTHLVEGINDGVAKAGTAYEHGRAFPARLDHRHQHHPRAHRRQDRAAHHQGLPRHLRDRPHQPAGFLQSLLPEARAAGRARAALRGERAHRSPTARSRRRSTTTRSRRSATSSPALGIEAVGDPLPPLLSQSRPRGARQGDPASAPSQHVRLGQPRAVARNIASSSAARPWSPTPISAPSVGAISARSTTHLRQEGFHGSFLVVQSTGGLYEADQAQQLLHPHAGIGPGRGRHRHAHAVPHARASRTRSPSTWAAPRRRPASSTRASR